MASMPLQEQPSPRVVSQAYRRVANSENPAPKSKGTRSLYTRWQAGHFVIHPKHSNFLVIWDMLITVLMITMSFKVPYEVGFKLLHHRDTASLFGNEELTTRISQVFYIDVVLQFFISNIDSKNHRWIVKADKIVKEYLHTTFLIDIISIMPYSWACHTMVMYLGDGYRFAGVLVLCSLLRLARAHRLINRYQQRVRLQYTYVNMTQLSAVLLLTVHANACMWGFTVGAEKFMGLQEGNTWADTLHTSKPALFAEVRAGEWQLYTAALYWSCMTTTSIGYGDIVPMNRIEAWVATFIMVQSGVIWAYIIGNVCAIASSLNAERTYYENQMDSLNVMMESFSLQAELKMQLREYFMKRRSMFFKQQQVELLRAMSPELQSKVAEFVQARVLGLSLFREVKEPAFVVGLFERFMHQVYPPRELIHLPSSLCNLTKGMLIRGHRIMTPGAIWGEAELLLHNKELLEHITPVALSYIDLQHLTRESLDELLKHHPHINHSIRRAACWMAVRRAVVFKLVTPTWWRLSRRQGSRHSFHTRQPSNVESSATSVREADVALPVNSASTTSTPSGEGEDSPTVKGLHELERRIDGIEDRLLEALSILRVLKDRPEPVGRLRTRL